ncbi:carnosine synthase 1-like isoform X3 [Crassostrea angulata]|uniref:ATP-grasp domain-containing protein n=3 Tax=Magallana TaxID=2171616 RepID=A0A8W8L3V0_MAGGI|nr:carnosine synthase 1 isoform X3 [Crassostrea gigas]XP_034301980.1 carnosine synthase 1 isoform X3 [Crassostrea gigas]XP_052673600.1 carnosine synthase 1-like isoform X3 [Crassostrea angulata]|eukprot:XP_019918543.1 PREDICTED: carnosine synthase 1 isoform X2 [Crassostrea gigas]
MSAKNKDSGRQVKKYPLATLFLKQLTADKYTTALGSYCAWNRHVNLSPPDFVKEVPENDKHIYNYYDALQYTLYETNYAETEDRTTDPRTTLPGSGISIVILASPVECMAILLEGGRRCPGDMLLVMSKSWITVVPSDLDPSMNKLLVHKAISFESGGRSFIDVFDPPRRVTYFVNFFTRSITDGQTGDGEDLEVNLECPMSSSLKLVRRTDDKFWTRIIMAEANVAYPATLAFAYKVSLQYDIPNDAKLKVVKLSSKEGIENVMQEEILSFLNRLDENADRMVVKPSGVKWHGSVGVTFHPRNEPKRIIDAAIQLFMALDAGDGILVEVFCGPDENDSELMRDYSFRLRANVCRGPNDVPITTTLICGVGKKNEPINGDNTKPQSYESTMIEWGLENDMERIKKLVVKGSANILKSIIRHENALTIEEKGGIGAQTDVIGIDYFLRKKEGVYVPYGIEVNSHDCTINCQLFEFINPSLSGYSVAPLIQTMIDRSQAFLIAGKKILLLNLGVSSKRFILDSAKKHRIKVVLVDTFPEDSSPIPDLVDQYIQYDSSDHTKDDEHADKIIEILEQQDIGIDGCCTFWEDCGPLAAIINEKLDLCGAGVKGALAAKKKSETHQVLSRRTGDIPHFPRTYLYTEKSIHVEDVNDLPSAVEEVGLPCILKLEYGSSAVGVKLCHDLEECTKMFTGLREHLTCESDHPGIGLGHGNSMVVMKPIVGTEHDVDLVLFERQLVAAYVSDNGPTRPGSFTETAACMPSCLRSDKVGQLVTAAYQCCTEIGLESGVFNVELKMTPTGPKLIEINARMGGFYNRHWILKCYGVDMVRCAFMIASGIKPIPPKIVPSCHIMGVMCVPSMHAEVFLSQKFKDAVAELKRQEDVIYTLIEDDFSYATAKTEEPICNIAVCAKNTAKAKSKLLALCSNLEVTTEQYDIPHYVSQFR